MHVARVEGSDLAGIGHVQGQSSDGLQLVATHEGLEGAIGRAVVDDDHFQVWMVDGHRRGDGLGHDGDFVVCRHVVAVTLHNAPGSSDISFAFELLAE